MGHQNLFFSSPLCKQSDQQLEKCLSYVFKLITEFQDRMKSRSFLQISDNNTYPFQQVERQTANISKQERSCGYQVYNQSLKFEEVQIDARSQQIRLDCVSSSKSMNNIKENEDWESQTCISGGKIQPMFYRSLDNWNIILHDKNTPMSGQKLLPRVTSQRTIASNSIQLSDLDSMPKHKTRRKRRLPQPREYKINSQIDNFSDSTVSHKSPRPHEDSHLDSAFGQSLPDVTKSSSSSKTYSSPSSGCSPEMSTRARRVLPQYNKFKLCQCKYEHVFEDIRGNYV